MRTLAAFLLLFAFWLIFSGHFDALHIGLGLVCSVLVAAVSSDLLFPDGFSSRSAITAWRFVQFAPWLLYQIVLANLHVVYLVFRPHELSPQVVRFKTHIRGDLARVTLGNSITLTPGTITMDIEDDEFSVHAVSDKAAAGLLNGEMELRVGRAFPSDHTDGVDRPQPRPLSE